MTAPLRRVPERLAHLRTDRRGLPVPYVNAWGVEDVTRFRIARDYHVHGMPALFMDDDPDGAPDFTRQNIARQRECMATDTCQVCGRYAPLEARVLVVATISVQAVDVPDLGRCAVITEPWLDRECAAFAVQKCPALIRRRHDEDLTVVPVAGRPRRIILSRGYVDGPLREESLARQPVMWAKVLLGQERR